MPQGFELIAGATIPYVQTSEQNTSRWAGGKRELHDSETLPVGNIVSCSTHGKNRGLEANSALNPLCSNLVISSESTHANASDS